MKSDLFEGRMTNSEDIQRFIFAGRGLFTVVSKKSGVRFTYKVTTNRPKKDRDHPIMFVKVLRGPNNETDYGYLGYLDTRNKDRLNAGRKGRPNSTSFKALDWLISRLDTNALDLVEFYHSGRCGACGRTLTVPESIETGLGPVCAGRQ